jgi:hypothetical protein
VANLNFTCPKFIMPRFDVFVKALRCNQSQWLVQI